MKNTKTKLQKRQNFLAIITIAVIGLMILPLVGCPDKGEDPPPPSAPVITVRWTGENKSTKELELEKGKTATLKVTVRSAWVQYDNEKKEIEWTTNDPTNSKVTVTGKPHLPVADSPSIYSGDFEAEVVALDYGEVTITVTYLKDPSKSATCKVTVPDVSVSLKKPEQPNLSFLLSAGEKETPLEAEVKHYTDTKNVTWSLVDNQGAADNRGIVTFTVDDNGKVFVTTVKVGTTNIIATSDEDPTKKSPPCAIAVYDDVPTSAQGIEMAQVPAGTFMMGKPSSESGYGFETPQHKVTLTKDFYISKSEVTQKQWAAVMGNDDLDYHISNNRYGKGDSYPMYSVSWYDVLVFCNDLSVKEHLTPAYKIKGSTETSTWGLVPNNSDSDWNAVTIDENADGYRLPTEAQWEYACRAGTTTAFNTGARFTSDTGWFSGNASDATHAVKTKSKNAWGLFDMHGNVNEWCWDWRGATEATTTSDGKTINIDVYYKTSPVNDPMGASSGTNRTVRGGAYDGSSGTEDTPSNLRSAYRVSALPYGGSEKIGFRIVRPVPVGE